MYVVPLVGSDSWNIETQIIMCLFFEYIQRLIIKMTIVQFDRAKSYKFAFRRLHAFVFSGMNMSSPLLGNT